MFRSKVFVGIVAFAAAVATAQAQSAGDLSHPAKVRQAVSRLLQANPKAQVWWFAGRVGRVYGNVPVGGLDTSDTAQQFVNLYADVFGVSPSDLILSRSTPIGNGKFEAVWFAQIHHGVPVDGAGLTVLVRPGLVQQVVLASPQIKPTPGAPPPARILSPDQAAKRVQSWMPYARYISSPEFVVWGNGEEGRYAYKVFADKGDLAHPEAWIFYVDAINGSLLQKKDEIYYVDVNGHFRAWMTPGLNPDTTWNPPQQFDYPFARARIVGGNSVFANANGDFTIPNGGSGPVTVEGALVGRWSTVQDQAGSNHVITMNVTPPGPANMLFNPSPTEFVTAQVNAFVHTEIVHNFAKSINSAYPGIDISIPTRVNINSTCNAYYSASTINFYRAGGGCPNTAYTTVVYHEYGHFIIAMGHNNPTGDYHEGVADVTATLLVDDPIVGRGFRGTPDSFVRNVDTPNVQYPCSGESHQCGLVIAGAFWDAKRELQNTMGNQAGLNHARFLYLNQILLSPSIDPGITIDVLTLDDDDGDITNGTPHYNEINAGFTAHNLPAPPLRLLRFFTSPADLSVMPANREIVFGVRIENLAGQYDFGTGKVHFRINGGAWQERALMTTSLDPSSELIPEFAFLPPQPVGTLIEWYLSARTTNNQTVTDVDPNTPHESLVANNLVTIFDDNFQTNQGWTVTNQNVTGGPWERGVPAGDGSRGDPPTDGDGSGMCYVTGLPGGNNDLDGGPTILTSPVFSMSGTNGIISLKYWMVSYNGNPDDLLIQISNNGGSSWVTVRTIRGGDSGAWTDLSFIASKYVTPTSNMRIRLWVADNPNDSVTEAGLDAVKIRRAQ